MAGLLGAAGGTKPFLVPMESKLWRGRGASGLLVSPTLGGGSGRGAPRHPSHHGAPFLGRGGLPCKASSWFPLKHQGPPSFARTVIKITGLPTAPLPDHTRGTQDPRIPCPNSLPPAPRAHSEIPPGSQGPAKDRLLGGEGQSWVSTYCAKPLSGREVAKCGKKGGRPWVQTALPRRNR